MQTPESQQIVKRFFEALRILKEHKVIRGKKTFTDRYGINRWNMNTLEKDPERDIFQAAWLSYLVKDYGISPRWLLTGEGPVMDENRSRGCRKQTIQKRKNSINKNS